jgi:hypothetical protein
MSPDFFRKYSNIITEAEAPVAPGAAPAPAPAPAAPAAKAPAPRAAPGPNQVEVTFVNSGYGITGNEKPQTVERLGMDLTPGGQPILFIKSPAYGDKMQADWDAKNNRWIVDQD